MNTKNYDRISAINYAKKWALSRNPRYYNFDAVGGDCTSFISQCLFAGSQKMNYNYENGWYYNNGYDKSFVGTGILPLAPPIHAVSTTSGCNNANL